MIDKIEEYSERLAKAKGAKNILKKQLRELLQKEEALAERSDFIEKARVIVKTVAEQTQKKIEFHFNGLVSTGLEAIFPDPYVFNLRFVPRKNKTEADLVFIKGENESTDILATGGGGVADIASYLLSVAVFSIKPTRPIFVRDENFKFLHSPVFQEKASKMIKQVSDKFGIQMILISDQPSLYKEADNIINVKIKDGVSHVEE